MKRSLEDADSCGSSSKRSHTSDSDDYDDLPFVEMEASGAPPAGPSTSASMCDSANPYAYLYGCMNARTAAALVEQLGSAYPQVFNAHATTAAFIKCDAYQASQIWVWRCAACPVRAHGPSETVTHAHLVAEPSGRVRWGCDRCAPSDYVEPAYNFKLALAIVTVFRDNRCANYIWQRFFSHPNLIALQASHACVVSGIASIESQLGTKAAASRSRELCEELLRAHAAHPAPAEFFVSRKRDIAALLTGHGKRLFSKVPGIDCHVPRQWLYTDALVDAPTPSAASASASSASASTISLSVASSVGSYRSGDAGAALDAVSGLYIDPPPVPAPVRTNNALAAFPVAFCEEEDAFKRMLLEYYAGSDAFSELDLVLLSGAIVQQHEYFIAAYTVKHCFNVDSPEQLFAYDKNTRFFYQWDGFHKKWTDGAAHLAPQATPLHALFSSAINALREPCASNEKALKHIKKFQNVIKRRSTTENVYKIISQDIVDLLRTMGLDGWLNTMVFDATSRYILCENRIVDLEDGGRLLPITPNYYISRPFDVCFEEHEQYVSDIGTDVALRYLHTIFCNNEAYDDNQAEIDYFLYSMFRTYIHTRLDRMIYWMQGPAATGKSTLIELFKKMMLKNQGTIMDVLLDGNAVKSANPELLNLRGARALFCGETGTGTFKNIPMMNAITGGDTLTARMLNSNAIVEFRINCCVFMLSNDVNVAERMKSEKALDNRIVVQILKCNFLAPHEYDEYAEEYDRSRFHQRRGDIAVDYPDISRQLFSLATQLVLRLRANASRNVGKVYYDCAPIPATMAEYKKELNAMVSPEYAFWALYVECDKTRAPNVQEVVVGASERHVNLGEISHIVAIFYQHLLKTEQFKLFVKKNEEVKSTAALSSRLRAELDRRTEFAYIRKRFLPTGSTVVSRQLMELDTHPFEGALKSRSGGYNDIRLKTEELRSLDMRVYNEYIEAVRGYFATRPNAPAQFA